MKPRNASPSSWKEAAMPASERIQTSAADLVREFSRYSDVALSRPVVVTSDGRPRHVLLSFDEYERLIGRDQLAFRAADTPDEFLDDLTRTAAAGL
jgi:PHD/YefM family antitoxin component YafN of YafNO toxin-antitoxin module